MVDLATSGTATKDSAVRAEGQLSGTLPETV
uniref:Macrophage alpha1-antitrypsin (alpha1-AT) mRNA 5'-end (L17) n=1 Tax=Homo sapiens TaxID=9606 RepID=V9H102_HUMAN|nr:unnamed protein product [Homo sapiens]